MKKLFSIIAFSCMLIGTIAAAPLCQYKLVMTDLYGDGWDGSAKLTLTDNNGSQEFKLPGGYSEQTVSVDYYGGEIKGTWTKGSFDQEIGFVIYAKNGSILYQHEVNDIMFPDFTITEDPCATLGEVEVSLLIPSDNNFDVAQDIYFVWYGTDLDKTEHKVKMAQEAGTRFWKVTADIQDYGYTYSFATDVYKNSMNEDEQTFVDEGPAPIDNNAPLCVEMGPVREFAIVAGVNVFRRYNYNTDGCNIKDHNYNVDPSTANVVVAPGQATFSWFPYKDVPKEMMLHIYFDGEPESTAYIEKLPFTYKWENKAELKIISWKVEAWDKNYNRVGVTFEKDEELIVPPTPYTVNNLAGKLVEGTNTAQISWDVIPEATSFWLRVQDANGYIVLDKGYTPEELSIEDGKYVATTTPFSKAGKASIYLTVFDKDKDWRGETYATFDVTTLPESIGEVEVAVLIPSNWECDFDVTGGVWFCWSDAGGENQWVKATADGKWFKTTLNVTGAYYNLAVGNKSKADWASAKKTEPINYLMQKSKLERFVMRYWSSYYLMEEENIQDKDYRVKSFLATVDKDAATVTYTITANKQLGPKYRVELYKSISDVSPYTTYIFEPEKDETNEIVRTIDSNYDSEQEFEKVMITAIGEDDNSICTAKEFLQTFTIPAKHCIPTDVTGTLNPDNSVSFSWNAAPEVEVYSVDLNYLSYSLGSWYIDTQEQAPVGGKYTVTIPKAYGKSGYDLRITAIVDGLTCSWTSNIVNISDVPDLGEVNIRVLVPTDNNFPNPENILFHWYPENEDSKRAYVTPTKNGQWYEATITAAAPYITFFVANTTDLSGDQSYVRLVNTNNACFEMKYNKYFGYDWSLMDDEKCAAVDHDYRVTDITLDQTTVPGLITATLTATDVAPVYSIYYRRSGTSDPYSLLERWTSEGKKTYTFPSPTDKNVNVDIQLYPEDENAEDIADYLEKTDIPILANKNLPTDLKVERAEDKQTITFSWTKNGTVDHFAIQVYDYYDIELEQDNITATTLTHTFYRTGKHTWFLTALDAENHVLGYVEGPEFAIASENLSPTNLYVSVATKTATIQWEAPDAVNKCAYKIVDSYYPEIIFAEGVAERKDGKFIVQYTYTEDKKQDFSLGAWAVADDEVTRISYTQWESFKIDGRLPDPTPETHATITVLDAPGGTVNSYVSGTYEKGTVINLQATADDGWYFDKWSNDNTYNNYDLTLTSDTVIAPIFKSNTKYQVKLSAGSGGKVNSEINGIYCGGEQLEFIATPNSGYDFKQWSDGNNEKRRTVILAEDMILSASFTKIPTYTLTVEIEGKGSVTLDGVEVEGNKKTVTGTGKSILVEAQPASGYEFKRYDDEGTSVTTASYNVAMTKTKTIKAVFTKKGEDIENINTQAEQPMKFIQDGQMYILRDGVIYTITGAKVK